VLGLTATPCRGDGRGLGGTFSTLIEAPQVPDLIEQGYLVKAKVYAPVDPDLRGVRTQAGDYVETQLAERMDKDKLVGDIVTHWHKYGERRKTVAFACSIGHSIHIRDEFVKAGVRSEHLDGSTPIDERAAILGRLASGETEVVCNCMVLTEGFDLPDMGCIILARPTKKMGLYRQMIGRGLRPADAKSDVVILDHSGAVFRHGLPEDRVAWTLDPDLRATAPEHAKRQSSHESKLIECSQCSSLRVGGKPCPNCGFLPKRPAEYMAHVDGDLGLVTNGRAKAGAFDPAQWHGMLTHIAEERGYKPGWVAHKYKEKFGNWPARQYVPPIEPSHEVLSWVRSRNIAYAKARATA
jgi:DNA repair protein RadD